MDHAGSGNILIFFIRRNVILEPTKTIHLAMHQLNIILKKKRKTQHFSEVH